MNDPERLLNDLERRIDKLSSDFRLENQAARSEIRAIKDDIKELRGSDRTFVTRERFAPVERLVFGFVGLVLVAVLMAIIALVIRQPV